MNLKVKKLHPLAKLPTKNHFNDAGYDLYCWNDYHLNPGVITSISTGIAIEIPDGYVGLIWDRSGMGSKGFKVFGGVIDAGYRGELILKIGYLSQSTYPSFIEAGSKVAQILIQKVENLDIEEVQELSPSERGTKGFGSSGK